MAVSDGAGGKSGNRVIIVSDPIAAAGFLASEVGSEFLIPDARASIGELHKPVSKIEGPKHF